MGNDGKTQKNINSWKYDKIHQGQGGWENKSFELSDVGFISQHTWSQSHPSVTGGKYGSYELCVEVNIAHSRQWVGWIACRWYSAKPREEIKFWLKWKLLHAVGLFQLLKCPRCALTCCFVVQITKMFKSCFQIVAAINAGKIGWIQQ